MEIIRTSDSMRVIRKAYGQSRQTIGFVPTMGALHEGHISLVKKAKEENDIILVSIFVNPTQFNDPEDLSNYPRTPEQDLKMLAAAGVDAVFTPGVDEIYPEPDTRSFDFGHLDKVMEGRHRPGHFQGVAQIVSILFELTLPHRAYFGQKDFQQLTLIRKLTEILKLETVIVSCPIVREPNGLAMSSRNQRLSKQDKESASLIFKTLKQITSKKPEVPPRELAAQAFDLLNSHPGMEVEYFSIVNPSDLTEIQHWKDSEKPVACTAVKINNVRLIDNMFFT